MILEAKRRACFISAYLLKLDGHPHGVVREGSSVGEMKVRCLGRQRLSFRDVGGVWKTNLILKQFGGRRVGRACPRGFFSSEWDLDLSIGACLLTPSAREYEVRHGKQVVARVERVGVCCPGWRVRGRRSLVDTDLILVGLVYQTITKNSGE